MKILHVIPSVAAVRGGPSQAVIQMVRALRSQGVDTEIATTNDNGKDLLDVPLNQLTEDLGEYGNVPIRFFARFSPNLNAVREFAYSWDLTIWLWRNIAKYDLVHVHAIFSYPSTIAMAIARLKKTPYINRPLGQLCTWSLQQSKLRKQTYLNVIERENLLHSKSLHFTADQEKAEFEQLGLNIPSFVLPHGVHTPNLIANAQVQVRETLKIPDDRPIILFLSRIHPKKGLEYLISALADLQEYKFALAIAGDGEPEYVHKIKDLLEVHNLSDRTHWLGFVKGETKNLYLQGADLFALTSHSENFGIAAIEALAAGTPVLITDGVAIAPMVKDQECGYVTTLDAEAIKISLQSFFDDFLPEQTAQNRSRLQQVINQNYSWQSISDRLTKIYQKLSA
ncbi:MAG: glycosyl transferase family 1 [Pseudanabaena sp.]|nr:MAG: glycosyl transferase family 1 [Pseudanabaena sp.]